MTDQPTWRKSSHSGSAGCVEVQITSDDVAIRHSRAPRAGGLIIRYTHTEWAAFLAGAKQGEFDLPEQP